MAFKISKREKKEKQEKEALCKKHNASSIPLGFAKGISTDIRANGSLLRAFSLPQGRQRRHCRRRQVRRG